MAPEISARHLDREDMEANRGASVNSAFAAAAYVLANNREAAIRVLSESEKLGMPLDLAESLVESALKKEWNCNKNLLQF